MSIASNIKTLRLAVSENVDIVAVSKTKPVSDILEAYKAGQRIFGENRVQEMLAKHIELPLDIEWHLIGHLQTNKVKFIAPFVRMVHSVDSFKLLNEINVQAAKSQRVIDCLLQFYIAREETKFGLSLHEAFEILDNPLFLHFNNIRIAGVMGMASFSDNTELVRSEFRQLRKIFETLENKYFSADVNFRHISMGMSGDYLLAIEEGATMIRVGSLIFGGRQ